MCLPSCFPASLGLSHSPKTVSLNGEFLTPSFHGGGEAWPQLKALSPTARDFCFLFLQLQDDSGGVGLNITTNFKNSPVVGLKPAASLFFYVLLGFIFPFNILPLTTYPSSNVSQLCPLDNLWTFLVTLFSFVFTSPENLRELNC